MVSWSAFFFDTENGGDVFLNRLLTFNRMPGVISLKTELFITAAAIT
jgi:hypothetical protein